MAGKRLIYLGALLGCVGFYIAYQEWLSWLLLVGVLWLPWLSLVLSLPAILSFRAAVECPESLPLGESGQLTIVGTSRFPVPPFRGRLRLRRWTTGESWLYKQGVSLKATHCGGILATPEKLWVYDYLGLFRFRARHARPGVTLVRPEPARMERPPDLSRYLARAWRSKPGGGFAENHELRIYRPGDSLNQVHWKLTAKTGKLTIREPMEPDRGLVLVTMDLNGTAEELDRKFGRLLWLGGCLLEENVKFEIRVLTGEGVRAFPVAREGELRTAIDQLLCCSPAKEGSIRDLETAASWRRHIGGEPDEA